MEPEKCYRLASMKPVNVSYLVNKLSKPYIDKMMVKTEWKKRTRVEIFFFTEVRSRSWLALRPCKTVSNYLSLSALFYTLLTALK